MPEPSWPKPRPLLPHYPSLLTSFQTMCNELRAFWAAPTSAWASWLRSGLLLSSAALLKWRHSTCCVRASTARIRPRKYQTAHSFSLYGAPPHLRIGRNACFDVDLLGAGASFLEFARRDEPEVPRGWTFWGSAVLIVAVRPFQQQHTSIQIHFHSSFTVRSAAHATVLATSVLYHVPRGWDFNTRENAAVPSLSGALLLRHCQSATGFTVCVDRANPQKRCPVHLKTDSRTVVNREKRSPIPVLTRGGA